jgi:phage gpG-like protein
VAGSVVVVGADRLQATLRRAARDVGHMDRAAASVGSQVTRDARGRAPKRTGRLARSITPRVVAPDVEIGSTLVYAGVIHNGWPRHNISAQPFLADTLAADQPRIVATYAADVDRALDNVKGA